MFHCQVAERTLSHFCVKDGLAITTGGPQKLGGGGPEPWESFKIYSEVGTGRYRAWVGENSCL